ncbi:MAG: ABC transporter permease [Betaproteobacteria bacterium]|nr:ABC transporter permease [Betaproteobacteria bacterium]
MPAPATQTIPAPDLRQVIASDGTRRFELSGAWTLRALRFRLTELAPRLAECAAAPSSQWDLRGVQAIDHAGAMLLWRAWGRRRAVDLVLKPEHESLFGDLDLPAEPMPVHARRDPLRLLVFLGRKLLSVLNHLTAVVAILGQVVLDTGFLVRQPARIPWREISSNIYRTGTQALGITALVGFLIGVVLSYLSSQQLKLFGADAFIVNILGISVIRELGPVLAAILVAGRSGSAITAQLGVMRVTQELDAMAVMGIPHTLRLILPKMLALAVSMPLIVLWTDAIALLGGMVAAHAELGIGYSYFLSSLPDAVPIANLWLGLGKGVVFGLLIALVACHFGLRIEPNTESLGIGTTNSVVTSITVVIIVDAVFAIMFKDVGIS